jgi:phage I-like protein
MADSAKQFLVIDKDGEGHLPVRQSPDGPLNHRLMGAAWAALHGGYRGNKYEGPDREEAIRKLKALYKSEGMETPSETATEATGNRQQASGANIYSRQLRLILGEPVGSVPAHGAAAGVTAPLYEHVICVTGAWVKNGKKFSITAHDLATMVENFEKRKNEMVEVDYEHASEQPEVACGGPVPAAGWIHGLRVDGAGTVAAATLVPLVAQIEWTPPAAEMIRLGQYRFISPAIDWASKDKQTGEEQGITLTSAALTNHPFLEELPALALSDNELESVAAVPQSRDRPNDGGDPATAGSPLQLGEKSMKTLTLKQVDGAHTVFDGEEPVGQIEHQHLCRYAEAHLEGSLPAQAGAKASEAALFAEIGVPGKSRAELKEILLAASRDQDARKEVERAGKAREELAKIFLAEKPDEDAAEALLATTLAPPQRGGESGEPRGARGVVCTLTELRRAERARKSIDAAMQAGKILPVDRPVAFSVYFSDPKAFDEWIAKRPANPRLTPPAGIAGTGLEGANARQQMAELVNAKREQLKREDPTGTGHMAFSDLTQRATALVRKENPELFRRYREEKQ